jgi:hypothetical protein
LLSSGQIGVPPTSVRLPRYPEVSNWGKVGWDRKRNEPVSRQRTSTTFREFMRDVAGRQQPLITISDRHAMTGKSCQLRPSRDREKFLVPAATLRRSQRFAALPGRTPATQRARGVPRPKRWRKSYRLGSGLMQALELLAGINRARPMARRFTVSLFCEDYENRDERAEDHDGLENDRAYEVFSCFRDFRF